MTATPARDALVLAHGAFHGPWCWQPLVERIESDGTRCVALDLNRGGLRPDVDAIQSAVDALREEGDRVHVIGHSLGCASISLLDPSSVASAIFLAGPVVGPGLPEVGEFIAPGFIEKLVPQEDGSALMPREYAHEVFYHRCTPAEAEWALDRLRPTFVYGSEEREPPLWEQVASTYVECTDDRAVRPDYQRTVAETFPNAATLDFDHSPMLGAPDALAEVVRRAMARAS